MSMVRCLPLGAAGFSVAVACLVPPLPQADRPNATASNPTTPTPHIRCAASISLSSCSLRMLQRTQHVALETSKRREYTYRALRVNLNLCDMVHLTQHSTRDGQ